MELDLNFKYCSGPSGIFYTNHCYPSLRNRYKLIKFPIHDNGNKPLTISLVNNKELTFPTDINKNWVLQAFFFFHSLKVVKWERFLHYLKDGEKVLDVK